MLRSGYPVYCLVYSAQRCSADLRTRDQSRDDPDDLRALLCDVLVPPGRKETHMTHETHETYEMANIAFIAMSKPCLVFVEQELPARSSSE